MGHVLYQLGFVNKRLMHKYEQESKKLGKASFAYAWVLDETEEERLVSSLMLGVGLKIDINKRKSKCMWSVWNCENAAVTGGCSFCMKHA